MTPTLTPPTPDPTTASVPLTPENPTAPAVQDACRRIPPLWPLRRFVAVNPFLGLSDLHFLAAAARLRRVAHGEILMSADYYLGQIESGAILHTDLQSAIDLARPTLPQPWAFYLEPWDLRDLGARLRKSKSAPPSPRVQSYADFLDERLGTARGAFLVEEISKWCSVYFDEGQSSWRMPWRSLPLYQAWRAAAEIDANPALNGWIHLTTTVKALPPVASDAIEMILAELRVPFGLHEEFLHRQLLSVSGWSSYIQYQVRERGMLGKEDPSLQELLAIRLAYDLALFYERQSDPVFIGGWEQCISDAQQFSPQIDLLPRYLAHVALEMAYQRQVVEKLSRTRATPTSQSSSRKVQAVFCIDVRSEVYRRALESSSDSIETLGFAGFFGMSIEYVRLGERQGSSQCPVLMLPGHKIHETIKEGSPGAEERSITNLRMGKRLHHAWNAFKTSAVSCFSFVETCGLYFGFRLAKDSLMIPGRGKEVNPMATNFILAEKPPGTAGPSPPRPHSPIGSRWPREPCGGWA